MSLAPPSVKIALSAPADFASSSIDFVDVASVCVTGSDAAFEVTSSSMSSAEVWDAGAFGFFVLFFGCAEVMLFVSTIAGSTHYRKVI